MIHILKSSGRNLLYINMVGGMIIGIMIADGKQAKENQTQPLF